MKFIVCGTDQYDQPLVEAYEYVPPTRIRKIKIWLSSLLPWNWGYHIGLTRFRRITDVRIEGK